MAAAAARFMKSLANEGFPEEAAFTLTRDWLNTMWEANAAAATRKTCPNCGCDK